MLGFWISGPKLLQSLKRKLGAGAFLDGAIVSHYQIEAARVSFGRCYMYLL